HVTGVQTCALPIFPQIPREYALASPQPQDSHVSNPPLAVADGRFFRPNRPESPNERGGDRTRGWSPHDKNNPKSGTAPDSPFPPTSEIRCHAKKRSILRRTHPCL